MGLPAEFGPDRNVIWKTELPQGFSSPIIHGSRIFLTGIREDKLVTFAVDRRTEKIVWEREAPRDRKERIDSRNHPAAASAVTDGTRVVTFFGDCGLLAYDVDGKVIIACDQSTGSFIAAFDAKTGGRHAVHQWLRLRRERAWAPRRGAAVRRSLCGC